MSYTNSKPELLAPGGSVEAFEAAVSAGADAVYFGARRFSARARAKNLEHDEIIHCLKLCRAGGIRAYAALNTRIRDSELKEALRFTETLLSAGVDALIVADIGLASLIHRHFPTAQLHASTQLTGTCAKDAEMLALHGFSRMVCPRELTLSEITELCESSPIPIEMFIHGAHCVSVSGQCMLSCVMGQRSGNRGDCAGPCRLPFCANKSKKERYDISLKDMCLASHITDILSCGAESLKIEGRLKSPSYVYGVTSIYRRLIDEGRNADKSELEALAEIFSRGGFSDGYFVGSYKSMLGVRGNAVETQTEIPKPAKVPLSARLTLACGDKAELTLTNKTVGKTVTVLGEFLSEAVGKIPTAASFEKSISKLGATPFELDDFELEYDGKCGVSAASLNALRRAAVEILLAPRRIEKVKVTPAKDTLMPEHTIIVRAAELSCAEQLCEDVLEFFDEIYLPLDDYRDYVKSGKPTEKIGLSLPPVMYGGDTEAVEASVRLAATCGSPVLVHTYGELLLAREAGVRFVCSHRFVVYNSESAKLLGTLGADGVTVSPELLVPGVAEVAENSGVPTAIIYGGRLPVMLCRRCMLSDGGRDCPQKRCGGYTAIAKPNICRGKLYDRTGTYFTVVGDRHCMTTVYNSVPLYCAEGELICMTAHVGRLFYIFSDESGEAVKAAVRHLTEGTPPAKTYKKLK